jgi:transposase
VWGGRAQAHAVLYRSTLVAVRDNPVLHIFYERLRRAVKAPKVAVTAYMRKLLAILNAMVKHQTPWQQNYASALDNEDSCSPYRINCCICQYLCIHAYTP